MAFNCILHYVRSAEHILSSVYASVYICLLLISLQTLFRFLLVFFFLIAEFPEVLRN